MRPIRWIVAVLVLAVCAPWAQAKTVKVGVIQLATPFAVEIEEAFRKTLNSYGYHEGENLQYIKKMGEAETAKYEVNRDQARALLAENVDVLVTIGTGASSPVWPLLKGKKTPQVFIGVTYPVQSGLIKKIGLPTGENITGISYGVSPEMRLKVFRTLFPDQKRFNKLGFVYSSRLEQEGIYVSELKKLTQTYGFNLSYIDFFNPESKTTDFSLAAKQIQDGNLDVIFGWYALDDFFNKSDAQRARFLSLPIPIMAITGHFTDVGAIGGILTNHFQLGAQGAEMVIKVLNGTPAGTIVPEEPREYLLEINLKRARALKIEIPQEAVKIAYRVVK
jgi:ABC-type uncharacterized transport system substrate-binding protein